MWLITLPLRVAVSSKTDFILNLNRYRNANHFELHKAKEEFETVVGRLLSGIPHQDKVTLEYVYIHGKGIVPDTNNVLAVVDKFFQDTLVKVGVLDDDGPEIVIATLFRPGIQDPARLGRVEVTIRAVQGTKK
jgi:hypothetical protein